MSTLLVKVTTAINGVSTSNTYTNLYHRILNNTRWKGSITLPEQTLCNLPGNYGKVEVWAYYPDKAVGSRDFYAYASAKIRQLTMVPAGNGGHFFSMSNIEFYKDQYKEAYELYKKGCPLARCLI